jgi:uncharacterized membrane protein YhaH (DUF805 family)
MKYFTFVLIGLPILFYGLIIVALIYLIVKRLKDKDKEDFEKRDN